jgi:ribosomal protein L36
MLTAAGKHTLSGWAHARTPGGMHQKTQNRRDSLHELPLFQGSPYRNHAHGGGWLICLGRTVDACAMCLLLVLLLVLSDPYQAQAGSKVACGGVILSSSAVRVPAVWRGKCASCRKSRNTTGNLMTERRFFFSPSKSTDHFSPPPPAASTDQPAGESFTNARASHSYKPGRDLSLCSSCLWVLCFFLSFFSYLPLPPTHTHHRLIMFRASLVTAFKSRSAVRLICDDCRTVKRGKATYVYCERNPRHKQRQGRRSRRKT